MVDLDPFDDEEELGIVHELIARHVLLTGSAIGERVLAEWRAAQRQFVAVIPRDYKRVRGSQQRAGRAAHRPLQIAV